MAKKKTPKRKTSAAVKAAADRAEARSKGKPIEEPKVPIDPPIITAAGTPGIGSARPVTEKELKAAAARKKAKEETKARMVYTPELGVLICERMEMRCPVKKRLLSLTEICEADDMPCIASVRKWRKEHPEFAAQYARAREERTHIMAEEVVEISDDETDNQRARNRMDSRKWFVGKVNRRDYGEANSVELSGPNGGPVQINDNTMTEAARRLAFMLRAGIENQRRAQAAKQIEAEINPAE